MVRPRRSLTRALRVAFCLAVLVLMLPADSVLAQDYSFSVDSNLVSVYIPEVCCSEFVVLVVGLFVVGLVLMGIAKAFEWVLKTIWPEQMEQIRQEMELDVPGDINVEKLKCQSCGGELSKDAVSLVQGAIMINCPYCGSTYQLTEAPKW